MTDRTQGECDRPAKRRVLIVAWYVSAEHRRWLGEHLDPERYECEYLGSPFRVSIRNRRTGPLKWAILLLLAIRARIALARGQHDLVVTAFPQLAALVGLMQRLTLERTPHVAWYFNCGHRYRGLRRAVSRFALGRVQRFVVYTKAERDAYARTFGRSPDCFRFTHLTGADLDPDAYAGSVEDLGIEGPYAASVGSSGRDFETLFRAVESTGTPTVVVTHPYALEGCDVPEDVTVLTSIPQEDYLRVVAGAELLVLTVDNRETASGQMSLIQGMALETPVVATRCIGTEDYIEDGETGDASDLARVLEELRSDPEETRRLATRGRQFAEEHFRDRASSRLLDELAGEILAAETAVTAR